LKEREVDVVNKENDLKIKMDAINAKAEGFEVREAEIKTIKENLEKQMKVVSKRKEELDQSTERIIKELETISRLTESQAKDQLIEAIRSKAVAEAMSIEKEAVANATANAAREAKEDRHPNDPTDVCRIHH
jgi:ribonuclease Y